MKSKNKICTLPWNHMYASNTGTLFPCCASHYTLGQAEKDGWTQHIEDPNIIKEISKKNNLKNLRESLLRGEEPEVCKGCFEKEKEDIWSYRKTANELFPETYEQLLNEKLVADSPMKLEFLDLRLGNKCNLACRMCNPSASKMLLQDFKDYLSDSNYGKELESLDWFENRLMYKNFVENSEHLKIINMAGGEPFIIDQTWEFLEMLIEKGVSKNIELRYNTNLTVIPEKAKKIWKHFKGVVLFLSIDGVDEVYEYIRYPAKFAKIDKNLEFLDGNYKEFNISSAKIQMTVQAYNVADIPKMTKYLQKFEKIEKVPILNLLEDPRGLSVSALPIDYQKLVGRKLKTFLMEVFELKNLKTLRTFKDFLRIVTFLAEGLLKHENYSEEKNLEFQKLTKFYDNRRGQSISSIID